MAKFRKIYKRLQNRLSRDFLFDGDDALFKKVLNSSKHYAEYGCGKSTIWVAENTSATIRSVDTDKAWVDFCQRRVRRPNVTVDWVDCGPVQSWGRPVSYDNRHNFSKYAQAIWREEPLPDTVLIDGRFRVLCFLVSLKYCAPGTKILFDDYTNRPHYHIVEQLLPRAEECGRQCLFIASEKSQIDHALLDYLLPKFEYVMD